MQTHLNVQPKDETLYVPEKARIAKIECLTDTAKFFALELLSGKSLGHDPGQFVIVSIPEIGEAPISVSSLPRADNIFELCVQAAGDVAKNLHALHEGDIVLIRGPFGHGFDKLMMERMRGKHLLLIGYGIGYMTLRSLIQHVVPEAAHYAKISILCGCKQPAERLYVNELADLVGMGGNVELLETIDRPAEGWNGNVGLITDLIPKVELVPQKTIVVMIGPRIMYKFALISLMVQKIPFENIYLSLEWRMICGVGTCGRCKMEDVYVCQAGPVFNYAEIQHNREAL
jgi:sulfhydrogenase subunit gamma (sulfur reductase)